MLWILLLVSTVNAGSLQRILEPAFGRQTCEVFSEYDSKCKSQATCDLFCLPDKDCSAPGVLQCGPIPKSDQDTIVRVHNELRNKVASGGESLGSPGPQPAGTNINVLSWSDELAETARKWVEQKNSNHDCDACRKSPNFPSQGQNLYISGFQGGHTANWEGAINSWYSEVSAFNGVNMTSGGGITGHYTQVLWAKTTKVGCAIYSDGQPCPWVHSSWSIFKCAMYLCNYVVAGNMGGESVYSISSSDACASYDNTYPMLCAN